MVHLGLVGMRVVLPSFYDPFDLLLVLYHLLGPSTLIMCSLSLMTFILWFYFVRPLDHWYPILSQLNFMVFIFGPLVKLTLWFLFFKIVGPLVPYSNSTCLYFYVLLVNTLKPRCHLSDLSRKLVKIRN